MKKLLNPLLIILLLWIITSSSYAHVPSKERGDPTFRRKTNIDGNQLRATIFNFCFSGRTGSVPDEVPYEYPKNTKRYYIALNAPFFAGQVKGNNDSTLRIVDVPNYRQSPSGASWNLEPIPNYFNTQVNKIAKSDDASSWPDVWPDKLTDASDPGWKDSWNGYFGKNRFLADQEMFYKSSDDRYNRYSYQPDSTDLTRRGLGLNIEARALEWSQVLISDVLFLIYNVQNDGTKDIPRFGTCIWLADFVGGDVDAQNNHAFFDLRNFVAWSTDNGTGGAPFAGTKVGVAATSYLETPGNSIDRIDNDNDGESGGPILDSTYLIGELPFDGIDNNGNGLVDENLADVPFGKGDYRQKGVSFADGIDNNGNAEVGSPVVTQQMIDDANTDAVTIAGKTYHWHRWPPNPESDPMQRGLDGKPIIHLINVVSTPTSVLGKAFKDNIDNNDNAHRGYTELPRVTRAMIDTAANDRYHRYRVPGTNVILYDLTLADSGKPYINKDGLRVWGVDEGIDEMIDESREDFVDNDDNWNPFSDDVGLDGVSGTGDFGEGDGKPTSGVGTSEPGEPHIDKTDVRESDQIGITRVQYLAAGAINFTTTADIYFWANFMIPASTLLEFYDPSLNLNGDYDLFVSSGLFPLNSGQIERISTAVVIGADTSDALRHRFYAQQAYNENYQFAKAPLEPTLKAVPGDRKVTLYWDEISEHSTDSYLEGLGALKHGESNFEGYKLYRATDPAFLDVYLITDKDGVPTYYKPMKIWDLVDGLKGIDSSGDYLGVNGAHFDMGSDNGIVHSFVDNTVQNGQTYYYALRAFSKGAEKYGIVPSESIFPISIEADGTVKLGKSVQKIVPNAPAAGYETSTIKTFKHITGSSTGTVGYTIVDPTAIIDNQTYRITFEDTLVPAARVGRPDTLRTRNFTLVNATNPFVLDTLISRSTLLNPTDEVPLTDGFRLNFQNESFVSINQALSGWNNNGRMHFSFIRFTYGFVKGTPLPKNYKVIFGPVGIDTSMAVDWRVSSVRKLVLPATPVNFKVLDLTDSSKVKFAYWPIIAPFDGKLKADVQDADHIIFLEKALADTLVTTWDFYLNGDTVNSIPQPGDTATVILTKPFLTADSYELTTSKQHINTATATADLDKIRVVPNPYLVAATWEPPTPYSSGKAPQSIHFNHLPSVCTLRIYTVNGELVTTIEHNAALINGSESWDLLTRDRLPAAYGVYIWHVTAPGIGEKIGKFAIIK